jgi:hypothetical protein
MTAPIPIELVVIAAAWLSLSIPLGPYYWRKQPLRLRRKHDHPR